ncbi:phthiocerol/phthiodiolone dimycocerosyl transferase family protein [Sphingomonas sp. S2-65]|uniref:phthiocerol/phthiodiolone dimycocerosyl transferase family protein n=1 Tax=Sphingomonas sp. S2-65 TaxID=2903960 RepID=UPI001F2FB933|nr:hypothetical protein [Sphingomonas sp. S2-65]UYY58093.1 hypothetical protein LZ586_15720 [Sphingomonas sp. S2-65]
MAFALVAELDGILEQEALVSALKAVQAVHPLLQVRIGTDDEGRLSFLRCDGPIALRAKRVPVMDLDQEIVGALGEPFALGDGPLLRVTAISEGEATSLICVFHHAVTDAKGALLILKQLLAATGGESLPGKADFLPLDHYVGYPTPPLLRGSIQPSRIEKGFTVASHCFTSQETGSFLELAKRHGVTFNSLLVAATAEPHQPALARSALRVMSPVDVRPLFEASAADGLFVTIAVSVRDAGEDMWHHARRIGDGIAAARTPKSIAGFVSAIGDRFASAGDYEAERDRLIANGPYDAIVTNLGVIAAARAIDGPRCLRILGPILKPFRGQDVIAASTYAGRLTLIQSSADGDADLLPQLRHLLETLSKEG